MKVTLSYYSLFYDLFKPRVRQLLFQDKGGKDREKKNASESQGVLVSSSFCDRALYCL